MIGVVRCRAKHVRRHRNEAGELRARSTVVEQDLSQLGGHEHVRDDNSEIAQPFAQHEPIAIGVEEVT